VKRETLGLAALLALLGAGWGLSQPLAKIAVNGGYRPFGLIFWQLAFSVVLLGGVMLVRGGGLPLGRPQLRLYAVITLIGTIVPSAAIYASTAHLPAGLISILISSVPMFAFPLALALGTDRLTLARVLGLLCGLCGVILIVGPEASLPDRAMAAFVPLALVAPLSYAIEGNVVAKWGTYGATPVQVLLGAGLVGLPCALVLSLATGQFIDPRPPWSLADAAVVLSAAINTAVYVAYVWLVGRAGATFAAQVSYFVTGFGVLWAMALLGEAYSGWIWGALGLMAVGLFLVQPRPRDPLAVAGGQDRIAPMGRSPDSHERVGQF
jgi:drug/metabolite transporter (DMT)-like permease